MGFSLDMNKEECWYLILCRLLMWSNSILLRKSYNFAHSELKWNWNVYVLLSKKTSFKITTEIHKSVRICCFSLFYIFVFWISLSFWLLVGQKKRNIRMSPWALGNVFWHLHHFKCQCGFALGLLTFVKQHRCSPFTSAIYKQNHRIFLVLLSYFTLKPYQATLKITWTFEILQITIHDLAHTKPCSCDSLYLGC